MGSVDRAFILVVEPARRALRGLIVYRGNLAQTMDRIRATRLRPHGIAPRNGRGRRHTIPIATIYALAALLDGFFLFDLRHLWNIVSYFNPTFPVFPWRFEAISFGRDFQAIRMNLYWPIVGFAYFINLDISFSICFFYLLAVIEEGLFNRFGVIISEANLLAPPLCPWAGK